MPRTGAGQGFESWLVGDNNNNNNNNNNNTQLVTCHMSMKTYQIWRNWIAGDSSCTLQTLCETLHCYSVIMRFHFFGAPTNIPMVHTLWFQQKVKQLRLPAVCNCNWEAPGCILSLFILIEFNFILFYFISIFSFCKHMHLTDVKIKLLLTYLLTFYSVFI